jgi:hypothetical protein
MHPVRFMASWAKAFPQNPLPSASIAFFVAGISSIHSFANCSASRAQKTAKAKSIWLPHLPSIHSRFLQISLANGRFSLKHHQKRSKKPSFAISNSPHYPPFYLSQIMPFLPKGFIGHSLESN